MRLFRLGRAELVVAIVKGGRATRDLPDRDLNPDCLNQNQECYRYTIGYCGRSRGGCELYDTARSRTIVPAPRFANVSPIALFDQRCGATRLQARYAFRSPMGRATGIELASEASDRQV